MPLKRNFLKLKHKIEIIKKLERGVSIRELAAEYDIGRSTIRKIRLSKSKLLEYTSVFSSEKKTHRFGKLHKLEQSLYEWFLLEQRKTGQTPTGPMIKLRAMFLKEQMCIEDSFYFSDGWLTSFKNRFGIKIRNDINGNSKNVSSSSNDEELEQDLQQEANTIETVANPHNVQLVEEIGTNGEEKKIDVIGSINHQLLSKLSLRSCNLLSKQLNKSNINGMVISWDDAEIYIEKLIQFFEHFQQFSFQDCIQVHMLRNTFQSAQIRFRHQQQNAE